MDGQSAYQYLVFPRRSVSFHITQPASTTIAQLSLSGRYDFDDLAVPISSAIGSFRSRTTDHDGRQPVDSLTVNLVEKGVTEVEGMLLTQNCSALYLLNLFYWPPIVPWELP